MITIVVGLVCAIVGFCICSLCAMAKISDLESENRMLRMKLNTRQNDSEE